MYDERLLKDSEAKKPEQLPPVGSMPLLSDNLSCWFGLSYASFCVLPRVLMEAMPHGWQEQMAKLLNEYSDTFPNQPDIGTRVQITKDKKLIKAPDWLLNYRHPDREAIDALKG